jgi:hypothetical protein
VTILVPSEAEKLINQKIETEKNIESLTAQSKQAWDQAKMYSDIAYNLGKKISLEKDAVKNLEEKLDLLQPDHPTEYAEEEEITELSDDWMQECYEK